MLPKWGNWNLSKYLLIKEEKWTALPRLLNLSPNNCEGNGHFPYHFPHLSSLFFAFSLNLNHRLVKRWFLWYCAHFPATWGPWCNRHRWNNNNKKQKRNFERGLGSSLIVLLVPAWTSLSLFSFSGFLFLSAFFFVFFFFWFFCCNQCFVLIDYITSWLVKSSQVERQGKASAESVGQWIGLLESIGLLFGAATCRNQMEQKK